MKLSIFCWLIILYILVGQIMFSHDIGFYSGSYIAYINAPEFGNDTVQEALDEFNSLTETDIVRKQGYRPIFIFEGKWIHEKLGILGVAYPAPLFCIIFLKKDIDEEWKKEIVLHEYLHCFNFQHDEEKATSLMYPYLMGVTYDSIVDYAHRLARKIIGK